MRKSLIFPLVVLIAAAATIVWMQRQPVAVPVLTVEQQSLEQWVVASGQVRNQSLARIGAEITGIVAERHVREGDEVKAGDVLISLRKDELQAQYEQARAALDQLQQQSYPQTRQSLQEARLAWQQASREARRRTDLAERGMLSAEQAEQARHQEQSRQTQLRRAELTEQAHKPGGSEERLLQQRLESARAALEKTRILAPFAGRIQTRSVEPGDQVQPGRVLLEIARHDGLEIVAAVDEKFIAPLELDQQAVVIADAWPEHELPARVSFMAPAVSESSGTLDIHLQVEDAQQYLRQGMTVSVSVLTAKKSSALALPRDYLQQQNGQWQLWVLENGLPQPRMVRLGLRAGTRVEVIQGLTAGEQLILPENLPPARRLVRPL